MIDMVEERPTQIPKTPKFRLAILLGLMSIFYGEVYAGSSFFWMWPFGENMANGLWGLLVTFPLYTFHSLFYLNLAQRTKRISLPQLYFWGMLFALYEAPITKVLWSGYPGSVGPSWGLVSGIAIMEFLVLVFFWHPVMSFMMPILTLEIFLQSATAKQTSVFRSHLPLLTWNKQSKWFYLIITIMTSGPMAFNGITHNFQPDLVLTASLALILIARLLIPMKSADVKMRDFRLGNKGFGVVIIYLIGLYLWATVSITPPNFVPILFSQPNNLFAGIVAIVAIAVIICVVLRVSRPDPLLNIERTLEIPNSPANAANIMTIRHLFGLWGLMAILVFLWGLVPLTSVLLLVILLLGIGLPTLGVIFAIGMTVGLFRKKVVQNERQTL